MLNIDITRATFLKNQDDTYTVLQMVGENVLKIPRAKISFSAEALINEDGEIFELLESAKHTTAKEKLSRILSGLGQSIRDTADHIKIALAGRTATPPPTGHVCSMCGKPLDIFDEQNDLAFERTLTYGSKRDGDHVHIHLCCDCLDQVLDLIESGNNMIDPNGKHIASPAGNAN